ncbi:hypothetical protein HFD88_008506 [Aspergillus terreus]|nr:hypothetical protein HFD88_008506 [Aspergillus terreus]
MEETQPPVLNYILSFLLVGVAWGFTTPFIRRAAADFNARQEQHQHQHQPAPALSSSEPTDEAQELTSYTDRTSNPASSSDSEEEEEDQPPPPPPAATRPAWMQSHSSSRSAWLRNKIVSVFWTVVNLLRTPAYAVPLVINLTGSVWFFLLVGKHELSLTVPLANSSAFLFTVLGEWYVERKVIEKETWAGMALVLGGIAICVQSKT